MICQECQCSSRFRRTAPVSAAKTVETVVKHDQENLNSAETTGDPLEARNRIRTGDPFLTMEVLYQLSYPGVVGLPAGYRSAYPG